MESFKLLFSLLLLSCFTIISVHSQTGGCSASCGNCQLNNVESLRSLVQSVVNQTVTETFQSVHQQLNESIDDRIAISQRDTPGYS